MNPLTFKEIFSTTIEVRRDERVTARFSLCYRKDKHSHNIFILRDSRLTTPRFPLRCVILFKLTTPPTGNNSGRCLFLCKLKVTFSFCCSTWWTGSITTTRSKWSPTRSSPTKPHQPRSPPYSSSTCWTGWRRWAVSTSCLCVCVCVCVCVCMCVV